MDLSRQEPSERAPIDRSSLKFMDRAIELGRAALGTTTPNPAVGAVLVRDGAVIGEGRTQPPGQMHAEIQALQAAGELARGAKLFVTLEPCCHWGRTPPCTAAIIKAGIAEVHIGALDPYPLVSGRGVDELEAAGIKVVIGERAEAAQELIAGFAKRIRTGQPLVTVKFAMSLDGKIATRTGNSQWITGEPARAAVHCMRAASDAIMVGLGTVIADDPRLTARPAALPERYPLRVVVDTRARMSPTAAVLGQPGRTLIATTELADQGRVEDLRQAGAEIVILPATEGRVDLGALLDELGRRDLTTVMVEAGGQLAGSLFDYGLVDRVAAFVAPIIIGGGEAPSPVGGLGVPFLSMTRTLDRLRVERLGDDILVTGYLCDLAEMTRVVRLEQPGAPQPHEDRPAHEDGDVINPGSSGGSVLTDVFGLPAQRASV